MQFQTNNEKMESQEAIVKSDGLELFTESFGQAEHPAILLIMGATASMVWWDRAFCEQLAGRGFYVIRYDNRDVGQSTCYPPGEPPYSTMDMATDVLAVMDAYGLDQAHLVGMSLGGMLAQIVAIDYPERVQSLTLIASGNWDDKPELPTIDQKVLDYHAMAATLNWENKAEVLEYMVGGWRILNGSRHPFDENLTAALAQTEINRARSLLSMFNHGGLKGGEELYGKADRIDTPSLIIHGTEDSVLPFAHALDMQQTIPDSKLLPIEGGGHEIHPLDYDMVIDAITNHVLKGEKLN